MSASGSVRSTDAISSDTGRPTSDGPPLRRKLAWLALLYFAEGMPFGIVKEVLPVYFKVHGMPLTEIGLLSLLGVPWTFKVAWSPLVDRFGQRRHWITGCLVVLSVLLATSTAFDPSAPTFGLWAVLLGFTIASATQDIAIDAFAVGLVDKGEEGDANGVRVTAYRLALIATGGGLILLADYWGLEWRVVFLLASATFAVLAVLAWRGPEVRVTKEAQLAWAGALRRWLLRSGAPAVFLFVLIYKLGDAAMGPMVKPFWLDRGLAASEVGIVSTSFGMVATIAGALSGGRLSSRWGIFTGLWLFGLAQAVSNLGYAAVAWIDPAHPQLAVASLSDVPAALAEPARAMIYAASVFESFTSGLGTAAFLSFLMNVCEKEHAAVQYAILSAVFALSRDVAGAASGWATTRLGYGSYFLLTFALALPAYALLPWVRRWVRE